MYAKVISSRFGRFSLGLLITTATTANAWGADQTVFSARFNPDDSTTQSPLTLVISRPTHAGTPSLREVKAEIRNGKQLEASCKVESVETLNDHSNVIDMKCRSARLAAFVSPVSVFYTPAASSRNRSPAVAKPAFVRFGSWLQGYQQAILRVDLDRSASFFTQQRELAMQLAQR